MIILSDKSFTHIVELGRSGQEEESDLTNYAVFFSFLFFYTQIPQIYTILLRWTAAHCGHKFPIQ